MQLGLRKAWLWAKLVVIILVVAWVTLFFVKNANNRTNVWLFFWGSPEGPVSLDVIVPVTAIVAVVVFYIVRKVTGVLQQISQVREAEKVRDREQRME